jgi:polycomb protein EED
MVNVIHLQPRKPPPFPLDSEGERLADTTEQMHLDEQRGLARIEGSPPIPRWEVRTISSSNTSAQTGDLSETLMACAMGMGGQIIVAVGVRGSIWIWNERSERGARLESYGDV